MRAPIALSAAKKIGPSVSARCSRETPVKKGNARPREGWGTKVIDRLDLGRAFPEMTGLSARNLKYAVSL
jgi:hypothetical protein